MYKSYRARVVRSVDVLDHNIAPPSRERHRPGDSHTESDGSVTNDELSVGVADEENSDVSGDAEDSADDPAEGTTMASDPARDERSDKESAVRLGTTSHSSRRGRSCQGSTKSNSRSSSGSSRANLRELT